MAVFNNLMKIKTKLTLSIENKGNYVNILLNFVYVISFKKFLHLHQTRPKTIGYSLIVLFLEKLNIYY